MTESNDGSEPTYDFDIAVSFAGEDREYVNDVVSRLKAADVQVFYDQDQAAEMWGENLVDFLQAVYHHRARYAILFISRHYVEKKWPGHERQAAQDRALQETSPYILPVRLDDSVLPGLNTTIGYLDARYIGVDGLIAAVLQKLGSGSQALAPPVFDGKVPRSSEAIATLLSERPPLWEYLLFAAVVRQGIDGLDDKYRDHVIEYASRKGVTLDDAEAARWLHDNMTEIQGIVASFNRILATDAQEAAFGKPGESGDPDRILHLGTRLVKVYEEFLDWSATLRATGIHNDNIRRAAEIEARFTDQPIEALRSFAEDFTEQCDTLIERLDRGEHIQLVMNIKLELEERLLDEHQSAIDAYWAE